MTLREIEDALDWHDNHTPTACPAHDWRESCYGWQCSRCGAFVAFGCEPCGCEPRMPVEDDAA